ncbi:MAG: hypothetical protein H0U49_06880 [Parachlamydiaceae bacterium]|nr:hypothetical protein [Parachlamydiaceae bacterium]
MTLKDIQRIFNRSLSRTFTLKKMLIIAVVLALCGILEVFFRSLGYHASKWVIMSLTFVPLFLCTGVLLSAGIWLIRVYHDEIKGKQVSYSEVLSRSWEIIIGASYFAIPILISYLLVWMLLGIFMLLKAVPGIGDFFVAVLAFAPFLLNVTSLLLCIFSVLLLYFITPIVALKGINRMQLANVVTKRLQGDIFTNLLLGGIAILPLCVCIGVLSTAAILTESMCLACEKPVYNAVQSFFVMIPFAALLAPAVIFFFNFAAESHVLMKSQELDKVEE